MLKFDSDIEPFPIAIPDPPNYPSMLAARKVLEENKIWIDRYRIAAWPPAVARAIERVMAGEADVDYLRQEIFHAVALYGNVFVFMWDPKESKWIPAITDRHKADKVPDP